MDNDGNFDNEQWRVSIWRKEDSYLGMQAGPGGKAPRSSKNLVLWNHLLLIKIYPQQPVMKQNQRII